MKRLFAVALLASTISGCGALDTLTGVDDGAPASTIPADVDTGLDIIEVTGDRIFPGAGALAGGLLSAAVIAYRALRRARALRDADSGDEG